MDVVKEVASVKNQMFKLNEQTIGIHKVCFEKMSNDLIKITAALKIQNDYFHELVQSFEYQKTVLQDIR